MADESGHAAARAYTVWVRALRKCTVLTGRALTREFLFKKIKPPWRWRLDNYRRKTAGFFFR